MKEDSVMEEVEVIEKTSANFAGDFQVACEDMQEFLYLQNWLKQYSLSYNMTEENNAIFVTIKNVTEDQLNKLSRKFSMNRWKKNVINSADKVTNFMVDTADFAANSVAVPVATATIKAAGKTAYVAGRAGFSIGSAVVGETIENTRNAYSDLITDPNVLKAKAELKSAFKNIKNKLLGDNKSSSNFKKI